jgi:thioredoxin 1
MLTDVLHISMPTFLIFKNGKVIDTIRGANPSALRTAVTRAASSANAGPTASGAAFQNKGYRLGADGTATTNAAGAGWTLPTGDAGGLADSMVRFFGLYFSTLFSFDAYAAAQASPFSINNAGRR